MTRPKISALDASGICQTWALQFSAASRNGLSASRLAEIAHEAVLDMQKIERAFRRQEVRR